MIGSHNAAISLADGYGNEDAYWENFLKYIPKAYLVCLYLAMFMQGMRTCVCVTTQRMEQKSTKDRLKDNQSKGYENILN